MPVAAGSSSIVDTRSTNASHSKIKKSPSHVAQNPHAWVSKHLTNQPPNGKFSGRRLGPQNQSKTTFAFPSHPSQTFQHSTPLYTLILQNTAPAPSRCGATQFTETLEPSRTVSVSRQRWVVRTEQGCTLYRDKVSPCRPVFVGTEEAYLISSP